ncbi:hypothetical protein [Cupriavidus oxalaticus]|nr:hypothetical protein [Cupriavidus oxalaticus]
MAQALVYAVAALSLPTLSGFRTLIAAMAGNRTPWDFHAAKHKYLI